MMKNHGIIIFFSTILCICSCKDSYTICTLSKDARFTAGFYRHIAGADVSITAPSFSLSLVGGSGAIYSGQANTGSFSIPLNPTVGSADYAITVSGGSTDTLTIVYTTQSVNLSADCGNVFYNTISAVHTTTHTLDSVKIVQPGINTTPGENVRIYF